MHRNWRGKAAASLLAVAAAFVAGQGGAAAQTAPAPSSGGQSPTGSTTDEQLNALRAQVQRNEEANALRQRNIRAVQEGERLEAELAAARLARERADHDRSQSALAVQMERMSETQRAQYEAEHERLTDTIALERRRAQDRRELANATERRGRSAFIPRTNAGAPGECNPRSPAVSDLNAAPQTIEAVLGNVQQCYFAFAERAEPFVNRRAAYGGIASFGALGGAIGGQAIAPSTAAAWGGLVLLPIIVEGTVDRPEFDSLDRVTARGLNWVNGRAVQMNAIERRLHREEGSLADQIKTVSSAWTTTDQGVLRALMSPPDPNPAGGAAQDPSPEVASAAAERIMDDIDDILQEANAARGDLEASEEHINALLPTWAQMRFNRVMDNYGTHRRDMTLRPQAAARSIVALPFSSLANFIRGSDERVRTQDYFASSVALTLRDLHSPMDLPAMSSREASAIDYLDLSNFPEAQREPIRQMVERANELREATVRARSLLEHARRVDQQGAPQFDVPGAESAQNEDAAGENQHTNETPATPTPPAPPTENGGDDSGKTPAPANP